MKPSGSTSPPAFEQVFEEERGWKGPSGKDRALGKPKGHFKKEILRHAHFLGVFFGGQHWLFPSLLQANSILGCGSSLDTTEQQFQESSSFLWRFYQKDSKENEI